MTEPAVKRVVIAGGGTAGWVAAAALVKHLGPLLDITLVESDEIGTVGVGESTIPTSRSFHELLTINEPAFMRATQATFKLGIVFENWGRAGDRYVHSFGEIGKRSTWMADFHHFWLEAQRQGFGGSLADYCFELQAAEAGKFFKGDNFPINYAYHLDATLYARFLRGLAEPAGVRRVEGKIARVEQDPESGFLTALALESGQRVEGDLFLDCTGFRAMLIEQTLQTGYEDWTRYLATNSAFAVQTRATGPAAPYTRAIAHEGGWRWRIPLQHRVGNGIVFSSDLMSDEQARLKLLNDIDGEALTEPRLIRYRTGARRKVWNKNCVALGLASGFIEPLESTSIHLVKVAVTRLIQEFPFGGCQPALAERFNQQSRHEIEGIRDFITLHYHLTERDDSPFWRRCREMEIPDSLAQRMASFREAAHAWQEGNDLFRVDSWVQVLLGQGLRPGSYHRLARMMDPGALRAALATLKGNIDAAVARMPSHEQFLASYRAASDG
ncbi:tryptophan halogenase [Sphingomonas naasensis]|uniref:Tryptophan 7-halogenase n=1 Tax=Sphingomonas naasensis TaxID=1344951 RepID=A0A4S1WS64_9SPHN|nr:tryptophan halogenase family protein [Sphingomonas naasensis]NIJ19050.1 tryptophan halogenase [Sphingomonas naasensis]TGX46248.1 tryptophan 7-halogenase [Sphingomonas naasensis]